MRRSRHIGGAVAVIGARSIGTPMAQIAHRYPSVDLIALSEG